MNIELFSELVRYLYDGMIKDDYSEFLNLLKDVTRSNKAVLCTGSDLHLDVDSESWREPIHSWFDIVEDDPLTKIALSLKPGVLITTTPAIHDCINGTKFHKIYNDVEAYHVSGFHNVINNIPITLSINRSKSHHEYSRDINNLISVLSKHVSQCMLIKSGKQNHEFRKNLILPLMEFCNFPVCVLDARCNIIDMNSNFCKWVIERRGDINTYKLNFQFHSDQALLERNVNQFNFIGFSEFVLHDGSLIRLLPAPSESGKTRIFLTIVSYHTVDTEWCIKAYSLTPKEKRLVDGLIDGLSLQEFSEKYYVSMNTVKTQMKSIFRKTNTHSQQSLIAKVLGKTVY
ncbi:helix-turn-helix transcriptional regulator [Photobacterium sp. TLY01]|uniref:helix-turn-helix transcriptional regulator n=1 Tax=Photobacterium sp. TLY01 TaxID=2907534 RepID=UPI001F4400C9|nr:helix-turn-helix transcriptional regulator [Photobacterium sp. TLY01]UIP28871.1 helix-turn-helix transcriptional regulator [Photobacterium sp. TLY01]